MPTDPSRSDFAPEHRIFWMLVKKADRRDDVARVYLAVQAAIAYQRESVDVESLASAMMAEGRRTMDAENDSIGADGLAYFYWLYDVELSSAGKHDLHQYCFRRRYDGATILADLKTASTPRSLQFQQTYERERRKLEAKRFLLLPNYRWHTTSQLFDLYARCARTPPP